MSHVSPESSQFEKSFKMMSLTCFEGNVVFINFLKEILLKKSMKDEKIAKIELF